MKPRLLRNRHIPVMTLILLVERGAAYGYSTYEPSLALVDEGREPVALLDSYQPQAEGHQKPRKAAADDMYATSYTVQDGRRMGRVAIRLYLCWRRTG